MKMSFEQTMTVYVERTEKALTALLGEGKESRVESAMRYGLLGAGKRIRAALLLACADMTGGADKNSTSLACAIECVHAYSLIHDDLPCMDDDDTRRGKPSCHIAYDEATALLAGDALLTLAFEVTGYLSDDAMAHEALTVLAAAAGSKGMIFGQELDISCADRSAESILRIHKYKTGCLFRAAAILGAVSAGANAFECDRFASRIGLVFQLVDDILDIGSASDEPNLAAVLSEEKARRTAQSLTDDAKRDLRAAYGEKADFLCAFADMLLNRIV